jgi:hypothetical protein
MTAGPAFRAIRLFHALALCVVLLAAGGAAAAPLKVRQQHPDARRERG